MENVYCMYLLNFALVQNELTRTGRTVQSSISSPKENKKAEGILSSENLALMWIQVCRNYIAVRKLILYFVKLKLNNRTSDFFDLWPNSGYTLSGLVVSLPASWNPRFHKLGLCNILLSINLQHIVIPENIEKTLCTVHFLPHETLGLSNSQVGALRNIPLSMNLEFVIEQNHWTKDESAITKSEHRNI